MYAQLGDIVFEGLKGFSSFERTQGATLAEMPVIGGKPRLQRTGTPLDEITLSMRFNIAFCDPRAEFDKLSSARLDGTVLPLLSGGGRLFGDFVIADLKESRTELDANGEPLDILCDATLKEHVREDELASAVQSAISGGLANLQNRPAVSLAAPVITTSAALIMRQVGAVTEGAAVVDRNSSRGILSSVIKSADAVKGFADKALDQISRAQELQAQTQQIADELQVLKAAANRVSTSGDINEARNNNRDLQQSAGRTRTASSSLVRLIATRR